MRHFLDYFAVSTNPRAMVEEFWGSICNPTLARALSDQRIEEFMVMQRSIVHKRPQRGMCDRLEWIGAPFFVQGAYKRLCEGQFEE